jgi:hypothetical protein
MMTAWVLRYWDPGDFMPGCESGTGILAGFE